MEKTRYMNGKLGLYMGSYGLGFLNIRGPPCRGTLVEAHGWGGGFGERWASMISVPGSRKGLESLELRLEERPGRAACMLGWEPSVWHHW